MADVGYYSLIERQKDGGFVAWVPDLPGVIASGRTEDEVIRKLFSDARERLHDMIMTGQPLPAARSADELSQDPGIYRRLLLIVS